MKKYVTSLKLFNFTILKKQSIRNEIINLGWIEIISLVLSVRSKRAKEKDHVASFHHLHFLTGSLVSFGHFKLLLYFYISACFLATIFTLKRSIAFWCDSSVPSTFLIAASTHFQINSTAFTVYHKAEHAKNLYTIIR